MAVFSPPPTCSASPGPATEGRKLTFIEGLLWAARYVGKLTDLPQTAVMPSTLSTQETPAQRRGERWPSWAQGGPARRRQSWDSDLGPRTPSNLSPPRVTVGSLHPLDKEQYGFLWLLGTQDLESVTGSALVPGGPVGRTGPASQYVTLEPPHVPGREGGGHRVHRLA